MLKLIGRLSLVIFSLPVLFSGTVDGRLLVPFLFLIWALLMKPVRDHYFRLCKTNQNQNNPEKIVIKTFDRSILTLSKKG